MFPLTCQWFHRHHTRAPKNSWLLVRLAEYNPVEDPAPGHCHRSESICPLEYSPRRPVLCRSLRERKDQFDPPERLACSDYRASTWTASRIQATTDLAYSRRLHFRILEAHKPMRTIKTIVVSGRKQRVVHLYCIYRLKNCFSRNLICFILQSRTS